jgi:hypothetical protein
MRFGDLVNKAKKVVDQRGGTEALKQDADELKDIARGQGSAQEKAKRAAEALKDPGAPGGEKPERSRDPRR